MRKVRLILILLLLLALALMGTSGRFLVLDDPRNSDVIVVLAGETDRRPVRALELLQQGYASRLILDVPAEGRIYQWGQPELARKYVEGLPQAGSISICLIQGSSTRDEALEAGRCLERAGAARGKVLLVTSEYHTRRALSVFQKVAPSHEFSVAAVYDSRQFGIQWWKHREWAKVAFYEWARLVWWWLVDRWR